MNQFNSLVLAIAVALSAGCAQVKNVVRPSAPTVTDAERELSAGLDFSGKQASNVDLSVAIVRSVLPGSNDYFPQVNAWAEYVLEVRTHDAGISLGSVTLINRNGESIQPAAHGVELSKVPNQAAEIAGTVGIGTAGVFLGAAAGIPIAGPLLLIGSVIRGPMRADAAARYNEDFEQKTRGGTITLDRNGRATFSVFFPLVDAPRALIVDYHFQESRGAGGRLEIPLSVVERINATPSPVNLAPPSIREAQVILNRLGLNAGPADGLVGKRTTEALRHFQRNSGLSPSGELDQATGDALRRAGGGG